MEDQRREASLTNDHDSLAMPEPQPLYTFTNIVINNSGITYQSHAQLGVNPGQFAEHEEDQYPPGYRFKPKDCELILYYLEKKILNQALPPNGIHEVKLYRYNPETLTGNYEPYGEKEWYFLTLRYRKYPNGDRPNRAAGDGYWKATGADKNVTHAGQVIGSKKTLVFYRGKATSGEKTNWIMHEYKASNSVGVLKPPNNDMRLDWVLCRIRLKNDSPPRTRINGQQDDEIEDQPLENNGNLEPYDNADQVVVPTLSGYHNPESQLGYLGTSYGSQNGPVARVSQDHAVPSVPTVTENYNPGSQMGYLDRYGNSASACPQNPQNGLAGVSQDHALPSIPKTLDLPLEQSSNYVQKTISDYETNSFQ